MRFEWDRQKTSANLEKHGVTFDEAVTVLTTPIIRAASAASSPSATRGKAAFLWYVIPNGEMRSGSSALAGLPRTRGIVMKSRRAAGSTDMRPEYTFDYSTAVRGKYYRRLLKEGSNVVVLEPDVARAFRSSAAVNDALRSLLQVSEVTRRLTTRSSRRPRGRRSINR